MNREDVAMDVTVQNVEILRGRLEQAEHYLAYFVENEANHEENLAQRHMMHEEARQFLASQQGEQQVDLASYMKGGVSERDWPEDFQHENGQYMCRCHECENTFIGYKRRVTCKACANKHPEQAEGAQGERDVFESFCTYMLDCTDEANRDFLFNFVQRWETWPDRAALAQPSPAEDMSAAQELAGVKAILNDMADALKRLTFHARTTGGTAGPDAALMNACERAERILSLGGMGAAFMRGCDEHESQPSPAAPELEAPTSVGVLILGGAVSSTELGDNDVTLDGQVVERIQRELVSDSEDVAVELMIVGQHYRILQALRADRDNARRTAEYWKAEHLAANAALDAAQARVAELERGTVYVEARRCSACGHGGVNDGADGLSACGHCEWTGPQPSKDECPDCLRKNCMSVACPECAGRYELVAEAKVAAPVAQAGQVPEGFTLAPTRMTLDKGTVESIAFHCGDGGVSYGDYQDGLLFIGDIRDDDGRMIHGLHLACAECEEEGYTTLVEFAAEPAQGGE